MITADEVVNNLVKTIYEIYFDKPLLNLSDSEVKLKELIDQEKSQLKKYINEITNLTYYPENDVHSVLNKTIDIVISRHAITRLIVKLITQKHNTYSLSAFQEAIKFIGKGFGFEIERLGYSSGLLSYFLENIEHWYKIKGTEDSIESITKIIFPYSNLLSVKYHIFKQRYGTAGKYTIIEFKDISTMTNANLLQYESNHFEEYSNVIENEEEFVKSSLPIISLVAYVNTVDITVKLRQYILEILDNNHYNTKYISLTKDFYISIKEAVMTYLLLINLFSDNEGGWIQRKWLDYSKPNTTLNYAVLQLYNRLFEYLPEKYDFYTDLIKSISNKIINDFDLILTYGDQEIYDYIVTYVAENNLQRPQSFAYDFIVLRNRGVLSNLISYINIVLNAKNIVDVPNNLFIYMLTENLTDNVTRLVYSISMLYNSNASNSYTFITKNDLYFLLLEISSKIEVELGIESVFSSYLSVLNIRSLEVKDIYDILSSIKPVHLHLSKIGFISDGKIFEEVNVKDCYIENINDTFNESVYCIKQLDYCTKVKEYGLNNNELSYQVSNQLTDFNTGIDLNQIVSLSNKEIRLDTCKIHIDTVFNKFAVVKKENTEKTYLTTHSNICRDLFILKESGTNNLEVLTW